MVAHIEHFKHSGWNISSPILTHLPSSGLAQVRHVGRDCASQQAPQRKSSLSWFLYSGVSSETGASHTLHPVGSRFRICSTQVSHKYTPICVGEVKTALPGPNAAEHWLQLVGRAALVIPAASAQA